jgi:hypothetical protein
MTMPPRSVAPILLKLPPKLPKGVRTALTMTAVFMSMPQGFGGLVISLASAAEDHRLAATVLFAACRCCRAPKENSDQALNRFLLILNYPPHLVNHFLHSAQMQKHGSLAAHVPHRSLTVLHTMNLPVRCIPLYFSMLTIF